MEPVVRSSSIFRDFFSAQRDEDQIISKIPNPRILTPDEHVEDAVVPQSPPPIPHTKQREIPSSPPPRVPEKVKVEEAIVPPKQEKQHEEQQQQHEQQHQHQQQQEEEIESTSPPPAAIVHDSPAEQGATNDRPTTTNYDYLADLEMIKVLGKGCMGKVSNNYYYYEVMVMSNKRCI